MKLASIDDFTSRNLFAAHQYRSPWGQNHQTPSVITIRHRHQTTGNILCLWLLRPTPNYTRKRWIMWRFCAVFPDC